MQDFGKGGGGQLRSTHKKRGGIQGDPSSGPMLKSLHPGPRGGGCRPLPPPPPPGSAPDVYVVRWRWGVYICVVGL